MAGGFSAVRSFAAICPLFGPETLRGGEAMEINYLAEFVVLARTGNFLSAAEELFISQSSLSKHIKNIEAELGTALFNRTTRKVSLTDAGEIFLQYAQEICRQQQAYRVALHNLLARRENSVALGVLPTMAQYDITNIIFTFQHSYPDAKLSLVMADSYDLRAKLEDGSVDFAFLRERGADEAFRRIYMCTDSLVAIVPANHPLADRREIGIEQLRGEELCVLEENTLLYDMCAEACAAAGFSMKVFYHGHHLTNIADFVTKGQAVALLMQGQTRFLRNPRIRVLKIVPEITTEINFCYFKERAVNAPGRNFIETVNSFVRGGRIDPAAVPDFVSELPGGRNGKPPRPPLTDLTDRDGG